jgi:hypothetical protein
VMRRSLNNNVFTLVAKWSGQNTITTIYIFSCDFKYCSFAVDSLTIMQFNH